MKKDVVFVCAAVKDGTLLSDMLAAQTPAAAKQKFEEMYKLSPQSIFGPFFPKLTRVIKRNTEIKFQTGTPKRATYRDWIVSAMPLVNPANSAFILFDSRIDKQKVKKPDATVVRLEEIKFEE
jgi:hypothetical protein